tara:strand:- start:5241 stop:5495 length:255 start_codon:yes stop_codon:yes gene_type:complete
MINGKYSPNEIVWGIPEYEKGLANMSDEQISSAASDAIYLAARNSTHNKYDAQASACYRECERRGNMNLYQSGYKEAARTHGFT